MAKLSEKKGFDKEILMLVKFTKEKYITDIMDGKLYMNTIRYFADLESKTKRFYNKCWGIKAPTFIF